MSIAIVTDSTSDIPSDLAEEMHIHIMPNFIIIDGQSYEDNIQISRTDFYKRLPLMKLFPTTATASAGMYTNLYDKLFHQGVNEIISIHAPVTLSGILNAASIAAQNFGKKVHVVDSGQVTMGLGFQVFAACEAAAKGLAAEGIIEIIKNVRSRVHLLAMLDTFEYIRRSGRVSWARASLGTLLNIKAFVSLKDGIVQRAGETRTRSRGIERLKSQLTALGPLERLALLHTNAEEDARAWLDHLEFKPAIPPLIVNVTTIIGAHVGPNALGYVAVTA